jgi:hypothetical protein
MNDQIELFLQGEGIREVILIRVPADSTVRELIAHAKTQGGIAVGEEELVLFLEDQDEPLALNAKLKDVGIAHRHRIHCHRCRHVKVSVNFNQATKERSFPSSATIKKIKLWADDQFQLKGVDATEHALQICGSSTRPDLDVHVGTLVQHAQCEICFDLVPKKRVEG